MENNNNEDKGKQNDANPNDAKSAAAEDIFKNKSKEAEGKEKKEEEKVEIFTTPVKVLIGAAGLVGAFIGVNGALLDNQIKRQNHPDLQKADSLGTSSGKLIGRKLYEGSMS